MKPAAMTVGAVLIGLLLLALAPAAGADDAPQKSPSDKPAPADRSGKTRHGEASFYDAKKFANKKMADGTPMNPHADIAASKTLPLGTTARVTNLDNGKSAVVEIRDRGPYEKGRIVDLSPKVADKLDMTEQGVAPVAVTPLALPPPKDARASDPAKRAASSSAPSPASSPAPSNER